MTSKESTKTSPSTDIITRRRRPKAAEDALSTDLTPSPENTPGETPSEPIAAVTVTQGTPALDDLLAADPTLLSAENHSDSALKDPALDAAEEQAEDLNVDFATLMATSA
jgi:hypothetical protein